VHAVQRAGLAVTIERTDTASFPRPARRPLYSVLDHQWFERATGAPLPSWQDAVGRYIGSRVATRAS